MTASDLSHEDRIVRALCRECEELERQLRVVERQRQAVMESYEMALAKIEDMERELVRWKPPEEVIADAIVEAFGKAGQ